MNRDPVVTSQLQQSGQHGEPGHSVQHFKYEYSYSEYVRAYLYLVVGMNVGGRTTVDVQLDLMVWPLSFSTMTDRPRIREKEDGIYHD